MTTNRAMERLEQLSREVRELEQNVKRHPLLACIMDPDATNGDIRSLSLEPQSVHQRKSVRTRTTYYPSPHRGDFDPVYRDRSADRGKVYYRSLPTDRRRTPIANQNDHQGVARRFRKPFGSQPLSLTSDQTAAYRRTVPMTVLDREPCRVPMDTFSFDSCTAIPLRAPRTVDQPSRTQFASMTDNCRFQYSDTALQPESNLRGKKGREAGRNVKFDMECSCDVTGPIDVRDVPRPSPRRQTVRFRSRTRPNSAAVSRGSSSMSERFRRPDQMRKKPMPTADCFAISKAVVDYGRKQKKEERDQSICVRRLLEKVARQRREESGAFDCPSEEPIPPCPMTCQPEPCDMPCVKICISQAVQTQPPPVDRMVQTMPSCTMTTKSSLPLFPYDSTVDNVRPDAKWWDYPVASRPDVTSDSPDESSDLESVRKLSEKLIEIKARSFAGLPDFSPAKPMLPCAVEDICSKAKVSVDCFPAKKESICTGILAENIVSCRSEEVLLRKKISKNLSAIGFPVPDCPTSTPFHIYTEADSGTKLIEKASENLSASDFSGERVDQTTSTEAVPVMKLEAVERNLSAAPMEADDEDCEDAPDLVDRATSAGDFRLIDRAVSSGRVETQKLINIEEDCCDKEEICEDAALKYTTQSTSTKTVLRMDKTVSGGEVIQTNRTTSTKSILRLEKSAGIAHPETGCKNTSTGALLREKITPVVDDDLMEDCSVELSDCTDDSCCTMSDDCDPAEMAHRATSTRRIPTRPQTTTYTQVSQPNVGNQATSMETVKTFEKNVSVVAQTLEESVQAVASSGKLTERGTNPEEIPKSILLDRSTSVRSVGPVKKSIGHRSTSTSRVQKFDQSVGGQLMERAAVQQDFHCGASQQSVRSLRPPRVRTTTRATSLSYVRKNSQSRSRVAMDQCSDELPECEPSEDSCPESCESWDEEELPAARSRLSRKKSSRPVLVVKKSLKNPVTENFTQTAAVEEVVGRGKMGYTQTSLISMPKKSVATTADAVIPSVFRRSDLAVQFPSQPDIRTCIPDPVPNCIPSKSENSQPTTTALEILKKIQDVQRNKITHEQSIQTVTPVMKSVDGTSTTPLPPKPSLRDLGVQNYGLIRKFDQMVQTNQPLPGTERGEQATFENTVAPKKDIPVGTSQPDLTENSVRRATPEKNPRSSSELFEAVVNRLNELRMTPPVPGSCNAQPTPPPLAEVRTPPKNQYRAKVDLESPSSSSSDDDSTTSGVAYSDGEYIQNPGAFDMTYVRSTVSRQKNRRRVSRRRTAPQSDCAIASPDSLPDSPKVKTLDRSLSLGEFQPGDNMGGIDGTVKFVLKRHCFAPTTRKAPRMGDFSPDESKIDDYSWAELSSGSSEFGELTHRT